MIPHFMLVRGKKEYLILRMGDVFHIIDADENLTKEKRLAILEKGCTPAEMQQMGLSGITIPKSDIESLTVTGCGSQDEVIFRLEREKLSYRFRQAYEQRRVDDFFRGIPRKQYKTRVRVKGGKKLDWRAQGQSFALYERLRPVGWLWNLGCFGLIVWLFAGEPSLKVWCWAVLGFAAVAVALDALLPQYFALMPEGHKRHGEPHRRAIDLSWGLGFLLLLFGAICRGRYHMMDHTKVLIASLIMTAVIGGVLLALCREFREELGKWFIALFFLLAVCFFGFVPHFNHILGNDLSPQTTTVVSTERLRGGRRSSTKYYATVRLPDLRKLTVGITREEYESLESGDEMVLLIGTGYFGIEYGMNG